MSTFKKQSQLFFPDSTSPNLKFNAVAYDVINHNDISTTYMDLTDRLSQEFRRGNEYILVGYQYDANAILAMPVKN